MHDVRVHVACTAFAWRTYQSTKRTSHPKKFQRYNNSTSMSDNKMAVTPPSCFQLPWFTLTFCTTVHFGAWRIFIIPPRPCLEKIKGCWRPDIFRIQPWANHSRIVSGSECVFLCRCMRITVRFFPHALTRSCIFRKTGGFEQVVLLVFVPIFSTLGRIKIISFCSSKNGKIILRYLQWLSGMINSLLGGLGCRIQIISSLGTSYTGSASAM